MMQTHTSKEFEQELRNLRERLALMGGRCEQQIRRAMLALSDRDSEMAREVTRADQDIDRDETEIDELAFQMLATRQPVAGDLRLVMLALKWVTDLERIGDLAAGIARRAVELTPMPPLEPQGELGRLAALVLRNLQRVLDAFSAKDADLATTVIQADSEIDRLNASLFAELIAHVATDASTVTRVIPLTSVCRYLERIGDHVKNLAEDVVYMVRAQDVRHRPLPAPAN
ncbi:MAG TPA: phosphate signaling complex protein PhoU [Kofleriaceae bacterium]|nr:phosphate signaling complex protein PhoU [Kofleriaceae bacterium]